MSSRNLYRLDDGSFVRTQGEIPKGQPIKKVEVPIDSQGLCDFLNQLRAEQVQPPVPAPAPTSVSRDITLQTREQFEEAWESFPLALKCHFASLAIEDCRINLK